MPTINKMVSLITYGYQAQLRLIKKLMINLYTKPGQRSDQNHWNLKKQARIRSFKLTKKIIQDRVEE